MRSEQHHGKRKYKVTILRVDGTPWIVEHCKHVLFKANRLIELYIGEHNIDRELILLPMDRVDHIYIEEENE